MTVYLVAGTKSKKYKALNKTMLGFFPVFTDLNSAKEYANKNGYPVIKLDTNADLV